MKWTTTSKLTVGLIVLSMVIPLSMAGAAGQEPPVIRDDGVAVELDNLWPASDHVVVTIGDDWQLTVTGLRTITDPPPMAEPRRPDTLLVYIYPDYPEYTNQCGLTPQPALTTLPPGAVTELPDGSFELSYNLADLLEPASCVKTLRGFAADGAFGSRIEVSDNYGSPVLYSEPFIADLTATCMCGVTDPYDGVDDAAGIVESLGLAADLEEALLEPLEEVVEKLDEEPSDVSDARDKLFNFVYGLEDAVEAGEISTEQANELLRYAAGILAALEF